MYFQNYRLRNTWLDNFLERPVSEDLFDRQHGKWAEALFQSE